MRNFRRIILIKQLLVTFYLLFPVSAAYASSVDRLPDESAESFVIRNGPPQTTLVHQVIETTKWDGKSTAIIAFYEQEFEESDQEYYRILSYIFIPDTDKTYRKILVDIFEPEGGDPEIEAVFFADFGRADHPKLFIICSWPQVHYDFQGKLYATFVYRAPCPNTKTDKLKFEDNISKKLYGGCECEWRDGTRTTAKYKTADDVKAVLRTIENSVGMNQNDLPDHRKRSSTM
jgi:hypothetical protein